MGEAEQAELFPHRASSVKVCPCDHHLGLMLCSKLTSDMGRGLEGSCEARSSPRLDAWTPGR